MQKSAKHLPNIKTGHHGDGRHIRSCRTLPPVWGILLIYLDLLVWGLEKIILFPKCWGIEIYHGRKQKKKHRKQNTSIYKKLTHLYITRDMSPSIYTYQTPTFGEKKHLSKPSRKTTQKGLHLDVPLEVLVKG